MSEETSAQFKTEGQPAFPVENTETDNSAVSPTGEETTSDQTQSQAGDNAGGEKKDGTDEAGFADHPRWKERESDWSKRFNEQETRHVTELTKLREDVEAKLAGMAPKGQSDNNVAAEIPDWFNGDEQSWSKYSTHTQQLVDQAVNLALKQIETKSSESQKLQDEATTHMQTELDAIETDKELNPQGLKVDRNKVLKFALDNYLVNQDGRWDYRKAFKFMNPKEVFAAKRALDDRKQLAGATTDDNRAETKQDSYMTNKDFSKPGNRPW